MNERKDINSTNTTVGKYAAAIIPAVLILAAGIWFLAAYSICLLESNIVSNRSRGCADALDEWVTLVVSEMEIHRDNIENYFSDTVSLEEYVSGTYDRYEEYPYGIYLGDEDGFYFDASGWEGDEDFIVTERPWYIDGSGSRDFVFGEPYVDAMTGEVCVSISAQIEIDEYLTVMAADLYATHPTTLVRRLRAESGVDEVLLVSGGEHIIVADTMNETTGTSMHDIDDDLYNEVDAYIDAGNEGVILVDDGTETWYISVMRAQYTGWYLISCVKVHTLLAPAIRVLPAYIILSIITIILLMIIVRNYTRTVNYIEYKAITDRLTGIMNREGFHRAVVRSIKEHPDSGMLVIMDLDNFKNINDNLGHPEGDVLLENFAGALREFFNRSSNIYARIGGDEFAVLIDGPINVDAADNMLSRFMSKCEGRFSERYAQYGFSVSIGAAFFEEGRDYDALYKKADECLYQAKQNGKGCWVIEGATKEEA